MPNQPATARDPRVKHAVWDDDKDAFFVSGHVDRSEFLEHIRPDVTRELGFMIDEAEYPNVDDVEYLWFRMLAPSEARRKGYDFGYIKASAPEKRKRGGPFPVTVVFV